MTRSTVAFIQDEDDQDVLDIPAVAPHTLAKPAHDITVGEMTPDELAYVINKALIHYHGEEPKGAPVEQSSDYGKHKNPVHNVMSVVGNTLHGVVDIGEGVLRGFVDVLTLGKSKR